MISLDAQREQPKRAIGLPAKIFKSAYHVALPFLLPAAIFLLLIAFFDPMPGKSAYIAVRTVAIVLAVFCAALITAHAVLSRDGRYVCYENKVTGAKLGIWIPLILMTFIVLLPFYIVFVTSIKTPTEANDLAFSWWPQKGVTFESYATVITELGGIGVDIWRTLGNTLFYATVPVAVGVFTSTLSAFAFAKLYYPGRDKVFLFLLFTMMFPTAMNASTSYMLYSSIGWLEFEPFSLPLTIPALFGGVGTMFFLRNFYQGVPDNMLDAARLDGCGKMKIFFYIMIPLGFPAIVVQFIMGFIGSYNNFTDALIYLKYPEQFTIPIAINFFDGQNSGNRTLMAAAAVMSLIPTLLLYAIFQNKILSGIQMSSGLKG